MTEKFDKIIIGAGIYGLYAALFCGSKKHGSQRVLVLECDPGPFQRATYVNQARVHQGYHYPRSLSTAMKSAGYFERFNRDYGFCVNREFEKIYAISSKFSWSDGMQFQKFCEAAGIPCEEIYAGRFFQKGMCDGAFLTREYTYDAMILKDYFMKKLSELPDVEIQYGVTVSGIQMLQDEYLISLKDGKSYRTAFLMNASYASTNQILDMLGYEKLKIKYELCEIILCNVNEKLRRYGITVMDGPFFSIMPFGKTDLHSLTSVTFTPHRTCYQDLPVFSCQKESEGYCSPQHLGNCNRCRAKPNTAYSYMAGLAGKYLKDEYGFCYNRSLFSMKPILMSSEIDDSRPTIIRQYSKNPSFISVLSGKINTVYDLDGVLGNGE